MTEKITEMHSLENLIEDPDSFSYITEVEPGIIETIDELIEGNRLDPSSEHDELWLRYFSTFNRLMKNFRTKIEKDNAKDGIKSHEEFIKSCFRLSIVPNIKRTSAQFTATDRYSLEGLRDGNGDPYFVFNVPKDT